MTNICFANSGCGYPYMYAFNNTHGLNTLIGSKHYHPSYMCVYKHADYASTMNDYTRCLRSFQYNDWYLPITLVFHSNHTDPRAIVGLSHVPVK